MELTSHPSFCYEGDAQTSQQGGSGSRKLELQGASLPGLEKTVLVLGPVPEVMGMAPGGRRQDASCDGRL